jgi:hypothetical protein
VIKETAPKLGIAVAPDVGVDVHVDSLPGMSTDVVVCKPKIEEAALIRSAPMLEASVNKPWRSGAAGRQPC